MPYIDKEDRKKFDDLIDALSPHIYTAGELNYVLTRIAHEYFSIGPKNYGALNEIIGAVECMKLEFVRRVVSPYEDKKAESNGDVLPKM